MTLLLMIKDISKCFSLDGNWKVISLVSSIAELKMGEEEDYELAGELFMGWISYMSMELAGAILKATSGRFS